MDDTPNICAGPFGAFYDFYIERPWLMRLIGRAAGAPLRSPYGLAALHAGGKPPALL